MHIGATGAALTGISNEALADHTDDPREEIPRLVRWRHTNHDNVETGESPPKWKPVYETMPRDDYIQLQGAVNGARKLQRKHHPDLAYGITGREVTGPGANIFVSHITTQRSNGEASRPNITFEEAREQIPSTAEVTVNVGGEQHRVTKPVVLKKTVREETAYFDTEYRPIPGGCQISPDGDSSYGTLATPCYSSAHGTYGWATAAHVVNRTVGTEVEQPEYGSIIGTARDAPSFGNGDVAFVDDSGDGTMTYDMASYNGDYENWDIKGSVSKSGCQNAVYYSYSVHAQGSRSGRTKGRAMDLIMADDHDAGGDLLVTNSEFDDGDSGGPHFDKDTDNEIYIYGIHDYVEKHDDDSDADSHATTAYWAEDEFNFTI